MQRSDSRMMIWEITALEGWVSKIISLPKNFKDDFIKDVSGTWFGENDNDCSLFNVIVCGYHFSFEIHLSNFLIYFFAWFVLITIIILTVDSITNCINLNFSCKNIVQRYNQNFKNGRKVIKLPITYESRQNDKLQ